MVHGNNALRVSGAPFICSSVTSSPMVITSWSLRADHRSQPPGSWHWARLKHPNWDKSEAPPHQSWSLLEPVVPEFFSWQHDLLKKQRKILCNLCKGLFINDVIIFGGYQDPLYPSGHCTMFLLSNKSCLKSNKLRPILKCHAISKKYLS